MFSFRIEVDIALKALSPAINDPSRSKLPWRSSEKLR
jgi:hypothetical protein